MNVKVWTTYVNYIQKKLTKASEQCDIYMQIQILQTSCQYYTDQEECLFTSPGLKSNGKLHGSVLHWYELTLGIFSCL